MAMTLRPRNPADSTPLCALVGATDLAAEGVRKALADVARRQSEVQTRVHAHVEQLQAELGKRRAELGTELGKRRSEALELLGEPRRLQAEFEQVSGLVVGRTLEAAARAGMRYGELAERGKSVLERLNSEKTAGDAPGQAATDTMEDTAPTGMAAAVPPDTTPDDHADTPTP
jgi:hypothetical protein